MSSPALALTLFGEKTREPFGPPTWMTCVGAIPAGVFPPAAAEPVDKLPGADAMDDFAAAKPMRAETMTDLEKSILTFVDGWSFEKCWIDY
jgi:hypothetical protein